MPGIIRNEPSESNLFLERPRIDKLLEKQLNSYMVTIIAGEGYGKTLGVHSFLRTREESVVWVQLSERDNLEWRFWENYTSALGLINPKLGREIAAFGFPNTGSDFERYMTFLLAETLPGKKYVTVVDDFHLVNAPPLLRFFERSFSV